MTGTHFDQLRQFTDANDARSENQNEGYLGNPEWEVLGTATYTVGQFDLTWRAHYYSSSSILGSVNLFAGVPSDQFNVGRTGAELFHDVSINVGVTERASLRLNVNNVFDNKPPAPGLNIHQGINDASIYLILGTSYSLAATYRF